MPRRKWLIEDNIMALYLALYGDEGLPMTEREVERLMREKQFAMRVRQFMAIDTAGRKGLSSGLKVVLFRRIYRIFKPMDRKQFGELVALIMKTKNRIRLSEDRARRLL